MEKKKLIDFNSSLQNDLILLNVIQKNDFQRLFVLVKEQNYPVTPFVLNCLVAFKQSFRINGLLCEAQNIDVSVYDWLVLYWGKEATNKFCCDHNLNMDLQQVPSSLLVHAKKWNELLKREDYDALLQAGQYQLLLENNKLHALCRTAEGRRVLSEVDTINSLYCLSILASIPVEERKQYWKRFIEHNPSEEHVIGSFHFLKNMELAQDLDDFGKLMIPKYSSVLTETAEGALILYKFGEHEKLNDFGWACVVYHTEPQHIGDVVAEAVKYGKISQLGRDEKERKLIMASSGAEMFIKKLEHNGDWATLKLYRSYLWQKGFFKLWWKVSKVN